MNKHLFALTVGLTIVCIAQAQIKKGDILLGGGINFNSQNTKPPPNLAVTNQTAVNVSPSIGIATRDNQLIGFNLAYAHAKTENTGNPTAKTDSYGAGFFLRRYKTLGSGFFLFAEGNFMGYYIHQKNNYYTGVGNFTDTKGYNLSLNFYPGVAYAINSHVQLETGFQGLFYASYGHSKTTITGYSDMKSNDFNLGTALNNSLGGFMVGFKWLL